VAVTRTEFLFNFPAFNNVRPLTLIDTTLEFQETGVNRSVFTSQFRADRLVMLETAVVLAASPQGMQMRLHTGVRTTFARSHWDEEIRQIRAAVGASRGSP
jgi:hypothetical protein